MSLEDDFRTGRGPLRQQRWDARYPDGFCARCGESKKITNQGYGGLCNSCDQRRKRDKARQEQEVANPTHELSAKMRKAICKRRTKYAQYLNLMDEFCFSVAEKRVGKSLARRHLQLMEFDLTAGGEFGIRVDKGTERTEDKRRIGVLCPPRKRANSMHGTISCGRSWSLAYQIVLPR